MSDINNKLTLTFEDNQILSSQIVRCFEKYNENRQLQLLNIKELKDEIYLHQNNNGNIWKNDIILPDLYELAQTLKSHLIENLYSNPESMFDVSGITPEAQNLANNHKAMLVNAFDRMNLRDEMEKLVDSVVETGEATLFIGWETKYKKKRRPITLEEKVLSVSDDGFVIDDIVAYDGPCVKCISPFDFVFDVENISNFDSCAKIYRTYLDIDDIVNNPSNNMLNEEICNELSAFSNSNDLKIIASVNSYKLIASDNKSKYKFSDDPNLTKAKKGNKLELLEFYGDLRLPDGKVLKNYLITVAARTRIIRFEPNPYIINPFVHASIIEDPNTKRGISPLRVALILSSISSNILNKQLDALSLTINPPYLAPKGCFKGEQTVKPGKIIEYDTALMPQQPTRLDFSQALKGWDFIKFFKSQIESATGVFRNMSGEIRENDAKTATEFNYSVSSQAIRLNMFIDSISRKLIIPMVQKVAEITGNFKFGNEVISYFDSGNIKFVDIDDNTRTTINFLYRYGDRKASLDRKAKFTHLFNFISSFTQMPNFASSIDWVKFFKFTLEQFGIENSSMFVKEDGSLTFDNTNVQKQNIK